MTNLIVNYDGTARYGDWLFDGIDTEGDGNLEFVEEAVVAWTAWRDYLRSKEEQSGN